MRRGEEAAERKVKAANQTFSIEDCWNWFLSSSWTASSSSSIVSVERCRGCEVSNGLCQTRYVVDFGSLDWLGYGGFRSVRNGTRHSRSNAWCKSSAGGQTPDRIVGESSTSDICDADRHPPRCGAKSCHRGPQTYEKPGDAKFISGPETGWAPGTRRGDHDGVP
jgi:hypothetical protein